MTILNGEQIVDTDFVSTSAGAGDEGKVPKLDPDGLLDTSFIPEFQSRLKTYSVAENMDGSTTPKAVCINADGNVQLAEADQTGILDKFIGFCNSSITDASIEYINSGNATSSPYSFTANAGSDRVLIVQVAVYRATAVANVTGVTFDGVAMTLINEITQGTLGTSTWYIPIGSNVSADSAKNIAVSGGNYTNIGIEGAVYSNVDQSTPVLQKAENSGSGTSGNVTLDPTQAYASKIINSVMFSGTALSSWNDGQTQRDYCTLTVSNTYASISDVTNKTGASVNYDFSFSGGTNPWMFHAFELKRVTLPTAQVRISGIQDFSGLTPNAKYYLSNTEGSISTSAGSTTVLLGKALSATELLIIQS